MAVFSIVVGLFVGLMLPFQAIINSRLSQTLGHPFSAALVNFLGGTVIFIVVNLLLPTGFPTFKVFSKVPLHLYSGGLIGAVFIISAIFVLPKIGSSNWVALIVFGQLVTSLVLDHYGILGLPIHKINVFRILGGFMLLGGVTLINKF